MRAVTAWSLLGSFDWDTLCTSTGDRVSYEEGVFEVSTGRPRETALADAIRATSECRTRRAGRLTR